MGSCGLVCLLLGGGCVQGWAVAGSRFVGSPDSSEHISPSPLQWDPRHSVKAGRAPPFMNLNSRSGVSAPSSSPGGPAWACLSPSPSGWGVMARGLRSLLWGEMAPTQGSVIPTARGPWAGQRELGGFLQVLTVSRGDQHLWV